MTPVSLQEQFGDIDIYLFDQLLRGRIRGDARVLDAGCGAGRNLVYLMREGMNVYGVDENPSAIAAIREQAARLAPATPHTHFSVAAIDALNFDDASMDVVICSAVLHFCRDEAHFNMCVGELWRVLAPNGLLFCRLASNIGIENEVIPLGNRRHRLPDGSTRFLVDAPLLAATSERLRGIPLDPIKTTVVENLRSMTTWVVGK